MIIGCFSLLFIVGSYCMDDVSLGYVTPTNLFQFSSYKGYFIQHLFGPGGVKAEYWLNDYSLALVLSYNVSDSFNSFQISPFYWYEVYSADGFYNLFQYNYYSLNSYTSYQSNNSVTPSKHALSHTLLSAYSDAQF